MRYHIDFELRRDARDACETPTNDAGHASRRDGFPAKAGLGADGDPRSRGFSVLVGIVSYFVELDRGLTDTEAPPCSPTG